MLMQTHKCMHVICVGVVHAQEYWLWLNCSPCWCHERNSVKIFKCAYTSMYLCTVAYQSTLQAYMQAVSLMCYTVIVLVFSASYICHKDGPLYEFCSFICSFICIFRSIFILPFQGITSELFICSTGDSLWDSMGW